MTLHPADWAGLAAGAPNATTDVAVLRYLLFAVGLSWAWTQARAPRAALLCGILLVQTALGFWILALGRPYGLLLEASATARLAHTAVVAASGSAAESYLSGDPSGGPFWTFVARGGLPDALVLLWPTLLPLVLLPLVAVAIVVFWADGERAPLAAALWLLFSTGDLDTLRGVGLLPGVWSHPRGLAVVLLVVVLVLGAGGLRRRSTLALTIAGLVALLLVPAPAANSSRLGAGSVLWLLTLDQGPWFVLAALGLRDRRDPAVITLIGGGGALVIASAFGAPFDPWVGHALYRVGLILAAAGPAAALAHSLGSRLAAGWPLVGRGREPRDVGAAALILLLAPGSFVVWWDARRFDPVYEASLEPVSANIREAMAWIRAHTPENAVFLAGETYAPAVAVLGGRRVLRAPTLMVSADDQRRLRTERLLVAGKDTTGLAERHGLTHVFVAPGDFLDHGIAWPDDLASRGPFRRLHGVPNGWQVYAIEPGS